MGFVSSGLRWVADQERGVRIRLAIIRGHLRLKGFPQTWRVYLEYLTDDGLKFSCRYYLRTAYVLLPYQSGGKMSAEVTSAVLLPRDLLVSHYRDAMVKSGKEPPTEAEVERVCRDIEEAIVAREQALHSSTAVPRVKVVFAEKVRSDYEAVRLLDAAPANDRFAAG